MEIFQFKLTEHNIQKCQNKKPQIYFENNVLVNIQSCCASGQVTSWSGFIIKCKITALSYICNMKQFLKA